MKNNEITVSDVAKLLGVKSELVKKWGKLFSEYLSASVSQAGKPRIYTQIDIQVLTVIYEFHDWEDDDGDYSSIYRALNSNEQFEDRYVRIAYFNTPVFKEPPENLDETWTHGVLIGGMTFAKDDWLSIAQSYRFCADTLTEHAISSGMPYHYTYPILYNYRHAIELYLKIATNFNDANDRTHSLANLVKKLKLQYNAQLSKWSQGYLDQWNQLDKKSTTFRYGESGPKDELWIDLNQLKMVTGTLCEELEKLIVKQCNTSNNLEVVRKEK